MTTGMMPSPGAAGTTAPARSWRGRLASVAADPMLRNGHTLTASSAVTAVLGLAYWAVAARRYDAATVGRNAAAISALMFLAGVAQLNLMSALVRFVPTAGPRGPAFVRNAYLLSATAALVVGAGFLALLDHVAHGLHFLLADPLLAGWFVVGTMIWTVFTMQDSVLTGIGRTWMVPAENAVYATAKVLLVVALAGSLAGEGIFLSWTLALIVSVVPVNLYLFRRGLRRHVPATVDLPSPGDLARFVVKDYFGSLCWIAATSLLPLVVINLAGSRANAYFTLSWQLAYMLYLVAANMGVALVVDTAADQSDLAGRWSATLRHGLKLLVPLCAVLVALAPDVLRIFGSGYALAGTTLLRLLVISALPNVVTASAVSACRAQRRTGLAFAILASICLPVFVLSAVLIPSVGVVGVGWAWLASELVVAAAVLGGRRYWLPTGPVPAGRPPEGVSV